MNVLLSIEPKFAEAILSRVKRWEFRKRKFRFHPEKAYIYCTRPVQKVVGFFEVGKVISGPSGKIWELCSEYGGISRGEFLRRFGYGEVCAIEILKPKRIRPPVKLDQLGVDAPPESFIYLDINKFSNLY